jgi:outer membrane lipoprotein carrier protein
VKTLALLLALSLPHSLLAATEASANLLHSFEARYAAARALQVNFLERYSQNGKFVRAEAGTAYFLRPGKMRWDYEAPEKNMFLVDGAFTWFYAPSDRTATRVPSKQSDDWRTPLAFLTSHMKLSRLCAKITTQSNSPNAQPDDTVFNCQLADAPPQSETTPNKSVLFEVSPQGELRRIVVQQEGAIELEFSFTNWQWNPPLEKSLFQFTPPRGVAIVNGLLPDASALRQ